MRSRRIMIVAGLFVLSMILYIDRVCISVAKGAVAKDLSLTDGQIGWVFGIFALGYALAQIPAGLLADRYGPRLILAGIVTAWSIFTGMTGLVTTFAVMLAVRFIFGVGEAGAFPGAARVFYNWLEPGQRGFANGLMFSGSRIGGALSMVLLPVMLGALGWRHSFMLLGAVGVLWAVAWYTFFRNTPAEAGLAGSAHTTSPTAAAPAPVGPTFGQVFTSRRLLLAMAQYFASNFTFFIALSWMQPYLKDRFKLSSVEAGAYAMWPLLFAAGSQWITGLIVDAIYRGKHRAWSRRLPAAIGFAMAAVGIASITIADTPLMVVVCFTIAVFGADMTISPSWAYCVDIGGKGSGAVSGSMNMLGNAGAFVSSITFPLLIRVTGSATSYFLLAAALNVVAVACWLGMTPPLEEREATATA